jgi:hypothetical protein
MFLTKKAKNAYRKPLKPIVKNKKEVILIQEPITVIGENVSTDITETTTETIVIEEAVVEVKEKKSKKKNNKE